jgi:hypothetical protein
VRKLIRKLHKDYEKTSQRKQSQILNVFGSMPSQRLKQTAM